MRTALTSPEEIKMAFKTMLAAIKRTSDVVDNNNHRRRKHAALFC